MANQITIEKALELVEFELGPEGWRVKSVKGTIWGDVRGHVWGDVRGTIWGDVRGHVWGDVRGTIWGDVRGHVWGDVQGTINGREWQFVETPKEKLKRLIEEGADKAQLLEAFKQLEDN